MLFRKKEPHLKRNSKKTLFLILLGVILVSVSLSSGCAGGSLLRPTPLIGKDRLVFRIVDNSEGVTYYTRNVWYDGENYRFRDVSGREISIVKSDNISVDVISSIDYYNNL